MTRASLDTGYFSVVLTQLSLSFCSHACLLLHSMGLTFLAPNRETLLGLPDSPQGVPAGQRAQVRPRLGQLESLTSLLKVIILACAHILDLVMGRGLWDTKHGSSGAKGWLWPPRTRQAPGFVVSLVHGLSCIQRSCNLERQMSGGQEGANTGG